jgi:hypothetical protein
MLEHLKTRWPEVTFVTHETRPWASVTFKGTRRKITLTLPNTSDFLLELPDLEFERPEPLIVDASVVYTSNDVVGGYTHATIEILTLED